MTTQRKFLGGNEERPRIVNEAIRKLQTVITKIFQGSPVSGATEWSPETTDGLSLGSTSRMWSDLFLASGGVINWNNGTYTITQSGATVTFSGALSVGAITATTISATSLTLSTPLAASSGGTGNKAGGAYAHMLFGGL